MGNEKKKCADCNPCEDQTIKVGSPSPLPDCNDDQPCSSFIRASCIIFDNLPNNPTLADLMDLYLDQYPIEEDDEIEQGAP